MPDHTGEHTPRLLGRVLVVVLTESLPATNVANEGRNSE